MVMGASLFLNQRFHNFLDKETKNIKVTEIPGISKLRAKFTYYTVSKRRNNSPISQEVLSNVILAFKTPLVY